MRTIFYGIMNVETRKIKSVGCSLTRAEEILSEMQSADPEGNYRIVYKWGNI